MSTDSATQMTPNFWNLFKAGNNFQLSCDSYIAGHVEAYSSLKMYLRVTQNWNGALIVKTDVYKESRIPSLALNEAVTVQASQIVYNNPQKTSGYFFLRTQMSSYSYSPVDSIAYVFIIGKPIRTKINFRYPDGRIATVSATSSCVARY